MTKSECEPDTVSHPVETIREILEDVDPYFGEDNYKVVSYIIDNNIRITIAISKFLENLLGVSSEFWLNRQRRYDEWKAKNDRR